MTEHPAEQQILDEAERLRAENQRLTEQLTIERAAHRMAVEAVEQLKLIVRARTHREHGCICEQCVETEHEVAKVVEELRVENERLKELLALSNDHLETAESRAKQRYSLKWRCCDQNSPPRKPAMKRCGGGERIAGIRAQRARACFGSIRRLW